MIRAEKRAALMDIRERLRHSEGLGVGKTTHQII
jgi:hypothetical protein